MRGDLVVTRTPRRRCTSPGCPNLAEGRCPYHQRLAGQQRVGWSELYGRDWPRRRLEYLAEHPVCVLCGRMAVIADHHPKGIKLLLRIGVSDPHDDKWLRALCWSCHSKETGRYHPGGWNRPK